MASAHHATTKDTAHIKAVATEIEEDTVAIVMQRTRIPTLANDEIVLHQKDREKLN